MADKHVPDYGQKHLHASEYGNTWSQHYECDMAASANDKIYLGHIPAGVEVQLVSRRNEAAGAGVTIDLGFEPTEGTPVADLDYFIDGADVAAAGTGVYPVVPIKFERPVDLVATVLGGNFTGTPRFDFVLFGNMVGVK